MPPSPLIAGSLISRMSRRAGSDRHRPRIKRNDYGEQRFRALGRAGDDYFKVAYTWRGQARRIISA